MCNAWNHSLGCTCGWGGDGHLGVSFGGSGGLFQTGNFRSAYADDDFCLPTACGKCGNSIFFVRHNGGNVSFDSLGPPWPKHPCYSDDEFGVSLRKSLASQLGLSSTEPKTTFGVVVSVDVRFFGSGRMRVRCADGTIIDEDVTSEGDLSRLPGRLVIVARGDKGEISFQPVARAIPTLAKFFRILDSKSDKVVAEFPYAQRQEARQRFDELDQQAPGKHKLREVNLLAYL